MAFQYGRLMFGGVSTYVRPEIAWGDTKRFTWKLEIGLRAIFE
jgi:hypothetical protein